MKMGNVLQELASLLFPRYCTICNRRLASSEGEVCNVCMMSKPFTPIFPDSFNNNMVKLFMGVMPIWKAQTMMRFIPKSKLANVIYELKYHDKPNVGITLGRLCAKMLIKTDFFDTVDIIIPIPLSKGRRRDRGYNQSEMIAIGLSEITDIGISTKHLKRIGFKKSQTHLSERERYDNVEGNFIVVNPHELKGKHILLVDDILTTGATLKSCGSEMAKSIEDIKISILTIGWTDD
ncbi:MAG: ComF family protein [Prevotella sp.]